MSLRRRVLRIVARSAATVVLLTIAAVLPWRWIAPPTTAFIVREHLASDEAVHHGWVGWKEISPNLPIAVVAAEDQKFPEHHGFDWSAIRDALRSNREGGALRGGSTITQQLAKNLYLWPGQDWVRKGLEAYLTVWIELLWPKRRILEVYLNVVEFGPGVFGVGDAAERLMGRPPADLTPYQSALLAAVLPSPKRMSAARPSAYVRSRADQILTSVRQLGGPAYLGGL